MTRVFEVKDKSGRTVYLSNERWSHINKQHPEVAPFLEELKAALENPTKTAEYQYDAAVRYNYRYIKSQKPPYMLVIVKYLNGEGFVITAYFVNAIK